MTSRFDAPRRQIAARQTSLRRSVRLFGRGVHTDQPVHMTLSPAAAGAGVVFCVAGETGDERLVPAHWTRVASTYLRTRLTCGDASVSTVEHVMAALLGLGVDNALVEIDGPEAPATDGSAQDFVAAIDEAGVATLAAPRRLLRVRKTVRVSDGAGWAELSPAETGLRLDVEIAYASALIGRQRLAIDLTPEVFRRDVAPARTFGFLRDAERLWSEGLALGASLDNTIVIDKEQPLNPHGLRFPDEFVRHKILDVIGDLALVGAPLVGAFRSYRGGHGLNVALIEKLMTTPGAAVWEGEGDDRDIRPRLAAAAQ